MLSALRGLEVPGGDRTPISPSARFFPQALFYAPGSQKGGRGPGGASLDVRPFLPHPHLFLSNMTILDTRGGGCHFENGAPPCFPVVVGG